MATCEQQVSTLGTQMLTSITSSGCFQWFYRSIPQGTAEEFVLMKEQHNGASKATLVSERRMFRYPLFKSTNSMFFILILLLSLLWAVLFLASIYRSSPAGDESPSWFAVWLLPTNGTTWFWVVVSVILYAIASAIIALFLCWKYSVVILNPHTRSLMTGTIRPWDDMQALLCTETAKPREFWKEWHARDIRGVRLAERSFTHGFTGMFVPHYRVELDLAQKEPNAPEDRSLGLFTFEAAPSSKENVQAFYEAVNATMGLPET